MDAAVRRVVVSGAIKVLVAAWLVQGAGWCAAQDAEAEPNSGRADIVVADFEGEDYGDWTVEGEAFGSSPAPGTLPGQMVVDGFRGKGLVNSYHQGDATTGSLTSPPFRIERKHLNFLIGGGMHPQTAYMELLIDGEPVRTATGPNDRPGGSERLIPGSWDVSEWEGRTATLRIVDEAQGGWGHINVDQIVQSDTPQRGPEPRQRSIKATARYLHVPVDRAAASVRLTLLDSATGQAFRDLDVRLAPDASKATFWSYLDLSAVAGKTLEAHAALVEGDGGLEGLTLSDELPGAEEMYREADRPQLHFTAKRGWLNDPNGLVLDEDGVYHLYFQHSPLSWEGDNKFWGHATSRDLVFWTEHPEAIFNHAYGDWVWSGSAVVDKGNTSGWGQEGKNPLVAAYTSTARGECVAYSNDGGLTWTEYEGNPVVRHKTVGRDPRLLWYAPGQHWVMVVYDEGDDGQARDVLFYTSPDLKTWTLGSRIAGFYECPDLFAIPLDGDPDDLAWILYGADGKYLVGDFDGRTFTPRHEGKHTLWHGRFYAAQTFSNVPNHRRIQIGWAAGIEFPGMPFNQQMNLPVELTLRTTKEGPRLFGNPVAELMKALPTGTVIEWAGGLPGGDAPPRAERCPELAVVTLSFTPGAETKAVGLNLRGAEIAYNPGEGVVSVGDHTMPLAAGEDGRVLLQIWLDRSSVEIFGNGGEAILSAPVRRSAEANAVLTLQAEGGPAEVHEFVLQPLRSIWGEPGAK